MLHEAEQPVTGPSSRPYGTQPTSTASSSPTPVITPSQCELGAHCPFLATPTSFAYDSPPRHSSLLRDGRMGKRQRTSVVSSSTSISSAPTSSSSGSLFDGPSSKSSSTAYVPSNSSHNSTSYTHTELFSTSITPTSTFNAPWTYTATQTSTGTAAAETSYVPGVIFNLTFAGDSDSQAVYSVPMSFGHGSQNKAEAVCTSKKDKRRTSSDWNGGDAQTVYLQIDLGSSDLWVASDTCTTSDCTSAPQLFNGTESLDAGVEVDLSYQAGEVSGEVYWEEVAIGEFGIGYQAFILATTVSNEGLGGGNYTGVLGLALPANSLILNKVPGTTSSDPDGATFLDNLFGSGTSAPSQRLFSLALERRDDVRTTSLFGIGALSSSLCPSPCTPPYSPIIAHPSLGAIGYLHWRIPIESITATTWSNPQHGSGANTTNIVLGASQIDPARSTPLAVLDSGGVPILVGYKAYADAIYAAYGISASSDGFYRMPCTQQLAITFTFAGQDYAAHPLDMSWPDPADPSQMTCIGAIQYSDGLGETGDFILGSAFMKNVYSIFRYPDQNRTTLWQPSVGLVSLTNASDASIDFYAVRSLRQSLSSISAAQRSTTSGSKPSTSSMPQVSGGSGSTAAGYKIASTAVIAAVSTVGFFVLAAAVFCAWWFWLRRKFGASGAVYAAPHTERKPHKSDLSTESLRSKKHNNMQRQKSMIEGYSDSEGDSWLSTTEGGDSIKLGYIPELLEEDEARKSRAADRSSAGSTLQNSSVDADGDEERGVQLIDISDNDTEQPPELAPVVTSRAASGRGGASPSAVRSVTFTSLTAGDAEVLSPRSQTSAYPQKRIHTSSSARSLSLSMSGPFPSPGRQSLMRPDTSPMYDIRANDYFTVTPGSSGSTTARGREVRRVSSGALEARDGSESRGRRSSPHPQGFISSTMVEEPSGMSATECEERRGEREG